MKQVLALAALFLGTKAPAATVEALSPYWDSVKQIEVVLNSPELSGKLSGQITGVRSLGNLAFEVTTEFCYTKVILQAQAPNHPGPTTYSVKSVDKPYCE